MASLVDPAQPQPIPGADHRRDSAAATSTATTLAAPDDNAAGDMAPGSESSPTASSPASDRDRRNSDQWDAAKVPPSRFQKRKGSIYAVPSSRDGHVDSNYAVKFHEKHAEKGYGKKQQQQ